MMGALRLGAYAAGAPRNDTNNPHMRMSWATRTPRPGEDRVSGVAAPGAAASPPRRTTRLTKPFSQATAERRSSSVRHHGRKITPRDLPRPALTDILTNESTRDRRPRAHH